MSQKPNSASSTDMPMDVGNEQNVPSNLPEVMTKGAFYPIIEIIDNMKLYAKSGTRYTVAIIAGFLSAGYQIYERPSIERVLDLITAPTIEMLVSKFYFDKSISYQVSDALSNFNASSISSIVQRKLLPTENILSGKNMAIRSAIQVGLRQIVDPTTSSLTEPNYDALVAQFLTSNGYKFLKSSIFE